MSGFAKYTSKDNFRLKESPFYRKGARGPDPIKSFVARSYATYSQKADRIRDARFAKSNELSRDYAVRNKREQMLSQAYMTERDPVKLKGLHGRLKLKLSRTGGAMSDGNVKVITARFRPRSNAPVAPVAKKNPTSHDSPSATTEISTPVSRPQIPPPSTPKPAKSRLIQQILYLASTEEHTQLQSKLNQLQRTNINAYNRAIQALQRNGYKFASGSGAKAVNQNSSRKRLDMN